MIDPRASGTPATATPTFANADALLRARNGLAEALIWAIVWATFGFACFIALIAVRSMTAALLMGSGAESLGHGLFAALFLVPFAFIVWLSIGFPVFVVVALSWRSLCRRRVVADSLANVASVCGSIGLVAASGLPVVQRFDVRQYPVDSLVTFVIVLLAVAVGGIVPRVWFSRLAIGRFGAASH